MGFELAEQSLEGGPKRNGFFGNLTTTMALLGGGPGDLSLLIPGRCLLGVLAGHAASSTDSWESTISR